MTRAAARRLARYLRRIGQPCRVVRHGAPGGRCFYTVERTT